MNETPQIGGESRSFLRTRTGARAVLIAGALLLSYAFFYQGGGWNQNSRFDLVRAIAERHTLRIDAYHENTGDKALFEGHYYSDKAPGLSFLAVPPVAAARPMLSAVGIDPTSRRALTTLSYLATVIGVAAPTALAGFGIYWLALRLGAGSAAATFAAVSFGVATPMWAYATLFWGHAVAAALLLGGFAAAVSLRVPGCSRRDQVLGGLLGLCVGWATLTEFTSVVPAALIVGLAAKHVWGRGVAPRARVLAAVAGGAFACGVVLTTYNVLAFRSAFGIGYSHEVNFPQMNEGFFGVGLPNLGVLKEILFGSYRGLLPLAPVIVAAPIGLYLLAKKRESGPAQSLPAAFRLYYILLNSSYNAWDGGWAYGPRFLTPALPFLCLALAAVWTRAPSMLRVLLVALVVWGAAVSLVAVSTTVQPPALPSGPSALFVRPPSYVKTPVTQLLWPSFRDGRFSLNTLTFEEGGSLSAKDGSDRATWNLGEQIGLAGHTSLLPLLLLWAATAAAWWQLGRHRGRRQV
jgi:hypothetical protein